MDKDSQKFELIKLFSKLYFKCYSKEEVITDYIQNTIAEKAVNLANKVINEMNMKKY